MLPLRTSFASLLRRRFAAGPLAAARSVHSSAAVESVNFNVIESKLDKNSADYKVRTLTDWPTALLFTASRAPSSHSLPQFA